MAELQCDVDRSFGSLSERDASDASATRGGLGRSISGRLARATRSTGLGSDYTEMAELE